MDVITQSIKNKENDLRGNFFELGGLLLEAQEKAVYKANYATFDAYVDSEFTFSSRQAYKFMKVASEFALDSGTEVASVTSKLGIEALYQLTYVPPSDRETIIKQVEDSPTPVREIKRLVKQIKVTKPSFQPERKEEEHYRMARQGALLGEELDAFKGQWEEAIETFKELRLKVKEWYDATEPFQHLDKERDRIVAKLNDIKPVPPLK